MYEYNKDLQRYNYRLPYELDGVFMVGWLDPFHDYPHGPVRTELVDKLWSMIRRRTKSFDLHVHVIRGIVPCVFCNEEIHANPESRYHFQPLGMSEIWIPYRSGWYAAPTMVVHYIDQHDYHPPRVFLDAIEFFDMDSPTISQDACDEAMRIAEERATQ